MNSQDNTTDMMVHLERYHYLKYLKVKEKGNIKRSQLSQITNLTTSDRQQSITKALYQMETLLTNSKRWKQLNSQYEW